MDESTKLTFIPDAANVIEFVEDHLPTHMRTIAGEFSELFTTRVIPDEWRLETLPSIEMIREQQPNLSMSDTKSIIRLRTSKGERFLQQLPRMVGEILSTKVMKQSSLSKYLKIE